MVPSERKLNVSNIQGAVWTLTLWLTEQFSMHILKSTIYIRIFERLFELVWKVTFNFVQECFFKCLFPVTFFISLHFLLPLNNISSQIITWHNFLKKITFKAPNEFIKSKLVSVTVCKNKTNNRSEHDLNRNFQHHELILCCYSQQDSGKTHNNYELLSTQTRCFIWLHCDFFTGKVIK